MSSPGRRPLPPPDPPESTRPAPTRLFLVRHGQSTWNEIRKIQGQSDPPLSKRGREQAERLADRFAKRSFTGFYVSDLRRCQETAAPLAGRLGQRPELRPDLREVALGDWEGLTAAEIEERFPGEWRRWTEEPSWDIVPSSEGARRFEKRVAGALEDIFGRHPHGDVLVVTHGGVIQVALHQAIGRNNSNGLFVFLIQNCSVSVLARDARGRLVITGVNDTAHLQ